MGKNAPKKSPAGMTCRCFAARLCRPPLFGRYAPSSLRPAQPRKTNRQRIYRRDVALTIPPRSNRIAPRSFDRHLYQDRNLIERFFARIKHFRRIATRYDKLADSFLSFIHIACTFIWLA